MAEFTEEQLQVAQDVIEASIRENFPNVSVRKGTVTKELMAAIASIGYAVVVNKQEEFDATDSLLDITENPDEIDDSVIDGILSNWFITRKQGSNSTGLLKVNVSTNRNRFIPVQNL